MGLFKFITDKGKNTIAQRDKVAAQAIKKSIGDLGLSKTVKVAVSGDRVNISGNVPDQATREKIILAAGNVAGISTVDDQMKATQRAKAATMHTVKAGDTLSKISKRYYKDAMKYKIIFEANKPMLKHPDKIYPGQVLRIPPLTKAEMA